MAGNFTPAAALAFIAFCALYTPCVAAIATIRREMNSKRWTAVCLGWQLLVAYVVSVIVYHLAALFL